jgi:hypothetical protein
LNPRRRWGCEDGYERAGDRIAAYLEGTVAYFEDVQTIFMDDVMSYAPARRLYDAHQRAFVEHLRALVEEGIAAGEFAGVDPLLAATAV